MKTRWSIINTTINRGAYFQVVLTAKTKDNQFSLSTFMCTVKVIYLQRKIAITYSSQITQLLVEKRVLFLQLGRLGSKLLNCKSTSIIIDHQSSNNIKNYWSSLINHQYS
jgi:flagellar biosynthesis/type III secretory pathway chaperone